MSHASLLVALSPADLEGKTVEEAVAHQMAPFDENGKWFADGSRWDWWEIGGRFGGQFEGRPEGGNAIRKADFDEEKLGAGRAASAAEQWERAQAESPGIRSVIYKIGPDTTKEAYVAARSRFCCHAFLKDRSWHESGRLGWFGSAAPTECQVKAAGAGGEYEGRCIHACDKTGARVVSWTGPRDGDDVWAELFVRRFVTPLPDDTLLVVVDFHV